MFAAIKIYTVLCRYVCFHKATKFIYIIYKQQILCGFLYNLAMNVTTYEIWSLKLVAGITRRDHMRPEVVLYKANATKVYNDLVT